MALKFQCRCGQRLSVPETAVGKRGKCSKCGATFVIPAPKAAAVPAAPATSPQDGLGDFADLPDLPDLRAGLMGPGGDLGDLLDDALDAPALPKVERNLSPAKPVSGQPTKRVDTRARFTKLANGIKLVFWGTLLSVAAVLIVFFVTLAGAFGMAVGLVAVAALAAAGMALFGGLLSIVGRVMCLAVPEQVRGKWLIFVAVACDLSGVATRIADAVTTLPAIAGLVANVLSLATSAFFVLFLKAVATYIKEEQLAEDAVAVFIWVAISIVSLLMAPFSVFIFPLLPLVFGLLGIGAMIYSVYKYLNLLQHLAERVRP
jgi:hypothetical protein